MNWKITVTSLCFFLCSSVKGDVQKTSVENEYLTTEQSRPTDNIKISDHLGNKYDVISTKETIPSKVKLDKLQSTMDFRKHFTTSSSVDLLKRQDRKNLYFTESSMLNESTNSVLSSSNAFTANEVVKYEVLHTQEENSTVGNKNIHGVSLGDYCEDTIECTVLNSFCTWSGKCQCKYGYVKSIYYGTTRCLGTVSLGEYCEENGQCSTSDSFCNFNICDCKDGYVKNNFRTKCLIERVSLGEYCEENEQCFNSYSLCNFHICDCKDGYVKNIYKTKCLKEVLLGEYCEENGQCSTSDSFCNFHSCDCKNGYVKNNFRTKCLIERVSLGGECEQSFQCSTSNSICDIRTKQCICANGYKKGTDFRSTICVKKQLNTAVTVWIVVGCVIVFIFGLIIGILVYLKRRKQAVTRNRPQARAQVPSPPVPAQYIYSRETERSGYQYPSHPGIWNLTNSELTQASAPQAEEIDKPPSYEEVINMNRSTENLIAEQTSQPFRYLPVQQQYSSSNHLSPR